MSGEFVPDEDLSRSTEEVDTRTVEEQYAAAAGAIVWQNIRRDEVTEAVETPSVRQIALDQLGAEDLSDFANLLEAHGRIPYSQLLEQSQLNSRRLAKLADEATLLAYGTLPEVERLQRDIETVGVLVPAIEERLEELLSERLQEIIMQRQIQHAYDMREAEQAAEALAAALDTVGFVPFPDSMTAEKRAQIAAQVLQPEVAPAATATLEQLAGYIRERYTTGDGLGRSAFAAYLFLEQPGRWFGLKELARTLYDDASDAVATKRLRSLVYQTQLGFNNTVLYRMLAARGYELERGWMQDPDTTEEATTMAFRAVPMGTAKPS